MTRGPPSHMTRYRTSNRVVVARLGAAVAVCTLALTASFVGLVAIVSGSATGLANRFPWYALFAAAVFVAGVVTLETGGKDGRKVLAGSTTVAIGGFLLAALAVEGVLFGLSGADLGSHLLAYLVAAALISTGLGYWALNHWREFARGRFSRP